MARGSQPGERRGGRKKGSRNKKTGKLVSAVEKKALELPEGATPLEFLIAVMRDENEDRHTRLDAAKAAAPYIHRKLASIEHTGRDGGAIETREVSELEAARRIAFLLTQAAEMGS